MSPETFDRERLGVGDWPTDEEGWAAVSEAAWDACEMSDPGGAVTPVAFAVDVTPDLSGACIASAWERPSLPPPAATGPAGSRVPALAGAGSRVVVEIPRGCFRDGTSWVIPRLKELVRKWRPIAVTISKNGPAAFLIAGAEKAGIELIPMGSAEEGQAFTLMITGIEDKKIIQLGRDQAPELWSAVASAEIRDVGDGGRSWSRKNSLVNISPINAATHAYWAFNKKRRNYDPLKSIG